MKKIILILFTPFFVSQSFAQSYASIKEMPVGEEIKYENLSKNIKTQVCKNIVSVPKVLGPYLLESGASIRNGEVLAKIYRNGGGGFAGASQQGENCVAKFYVDGSHGGSSYNTKFSCNVSEIYKNDDSKPSFRIAYVDTQSCK